MKVISFKDQMSYISYVMEMFSDLFCSKEVMYFIACVSSLETGYGVSTAFKKYNNLFGMSVAKHRPQLGVACHYDNGSLRPYAWYLSVNDCVVDFMLFLTYQRFSFSDLFDINAFVAKFKLIRYNPSDEYVDSILYIYNKFCSNFNLCAYEKSNKKFRSKVRS